MLLGVLALAGLALAACEPLKPAAEPPPPPELPPICVPEPVRDVPGDSNLATTPAPEPGCTPICLPGQDPRQKAAIQPDPEPTTPDCIPICPPSDGGGGPMVGPNAAARCIRVPIPCVPGFDIPGCTNFCPPGQEQPAPAAAIEPVPGGERCTPLCTLIPRGSPGECEVAELPRS